MNIRLFDINNESPEKIWRLFRTVYGSDNAIRQRWQWEFMCHPKKQEIRIFVAEEGTQIVGMTVRMPLTLMVDGRPVKAECATNSMVDPEYRGRGIIRQLYEKAAESGALQLSMGTMPYMLQQLVRMGYQQVLQALSRVVLLDPLKWIGTKIGKQKRHNVEVKPGATYSGTYRLVKESGCLPLTLPSSGLLKAERSREWVHWRYFEIPLRSYHFYASFDGGCLTSWFVLRMDGNNAFLVDIGWDQKRANVTEILKAATRISAQYAAIKMTFWGTLGKVHRSLLWRGGMRRDVGLQIWFYSSDTFWSNYDWDQAHLVLADSDIDYL